MEAHANSVRIRRDSNCTLIQGTALVHQMLKCSVKITDRLGTRLESVVDDDLEAVEQQQPLQTTTQQRGGRGGGCSGSFHREKVMAARPGLERMPSSAKLLSSIKHKISNASHFMQVGHFFLYFFSNNTRIGAPSNYNTTYAIYLPNYKVRLCNF